MKHEQNGYVMLHANTPCLSLQLANRWDTAPVIRHISNPQQSHGYNKLSFTNDRQDGTKENMHA